MQGILAGESVDSSNLLFVSNPTTIPPAQSESLFVRFVFDDSCVGTLEAGKKYTWHINSASSGYAQLVLTMPSNNPYPAGGNVYAWAGGGSHDSRDFRFRTFGDSSTSNLCIKSGLICVVDKCDGRKDHLHRSFIQFSI